VQGESADQAKSEAWPVFRESNAGATEMTLIRRSFLTSLIVLVLLWPHSFLYAKNLFTVTSVHDGDTINCQGYGIIFRVRLAGIDAPEKGSKKRSEQPYAEEARKYLENLILGKKVTIKQITLDHHNLISAIIYLDRSRGLFSSTSSRQNINLEMLKQGYAEAFRGKHMIFDIRPYLEAEKEAKAQKLNIWSQKKYVSPKKWRSKD
jgi:endonuclease YncB( thermonuclease family)